MGLPKDCTIRLANKFAKGEKNLITDVMGVKVGHITLDDERKDIHTGVTAILPHGGNLFQDKVMAASTVINGFGKSVGLVQVEELGTIEAPILMTNTLSVGAALHGVVRYMLEQNPDIGSSTGTVNCVVAECNDGSLNDIRGLHVTPEHAEAAIRCADTSFEEGAVGAGAGMICMGLKGGIGSASRRVTLDQQTFSIGALVLSNFGVKGNLRIDGLRMEAAKPEYSSEQGSVIIVLATELPLNERQLKRMAKRSVVGLARTGSYLGNGSGDIAIAFSTANRVPHYSERAILPIQMIHDDELDPIFEATAEAVEEAVLSSLYHARTTEGIRENKVFSLKDVIG